MLANATFLASALTAGIIAGLLIARYAGRGRKPAKLELLTTLGALLTAVVLLSVSAVAVATPDRSESAAAAEETCWNPHPALTEDGWITVCSTWY
jgi:hypothetical protein